MSSECSLTPEPSLQAQAPLTTSLSSGSTALDQLEVTWFSLESELNLHLSM